MKIHVTTGAICNTTDNKIYATDTPEKDWPNDRFPFYSGTRMYREGSGTRQSG